MTAKNVVPHFFRSAWPPPRLVSVAAAAVRTRRRRSPARRLAPRLAANTHSARPTTRGVACAALRADLRVLLRVLHTALLCKLGGIGASTNKETARTLGEVGAPRPRTTEFYPKSVPLPEPESLPATDAILTVSYTHSPSPRDVEESRMPSSA